MSSTQLAMQAYSRHRSQTKSLRDLEYEVLLGSTRELKRLQVQSSPPFPQLAAVLNNNEKIWTEIGVQVAEKDNALPPELRAKLFYLSQFVAHRTAVILRGDSNLESLIDTNLAVLRGLKGGV